jgi:glycosyltransferase involved in cell wall biosynthesis
VRRLKVLEMIDKPFLGGGQVHLLSIATHLDRAAFDVSVASKEGGPLEALAAASGLRFFPVPFRKGIDLRLVSEIARILRDNAIDILHTHGGVAGVFGRWAAGGGRTPVIVHTLHGIHYLHYRNPFSKYFSILQERYFSRRTNAVVFVSGADFESGRKWRLARPEKMRLIRNGVDIGGLLHPGIPASGVDEIRFRLKLASPVVGTVARLHRQKGIVYLLEAAQEIHRQRPEAKIVVVGGGPLENTLRRKAGRSGLGRNLLLLGERADARELLFLFDIFVLPSLWEGLPLALIEAATLGKPIVATDIDGVREIVSEGETGLLVPPKNPDRLAAAILRLLNDPELSARLGQNARSAIPARFSLSRMVEEIGQLYLELAGSKFSR